MNENKTMNLAQSLAIDSQLRLPGSAGRLLKQVRDIEQVATLFRDAGLVKAVPKPTIVNLRVAGIATKSCLDKVLGGFIYASAAVRTDLLIDDNKVSTVGSDSVSELDDIDFEAETITIRRTLNRLKVFDNPDKKTDIVIGEPKTIKAKRTIPLQDFLIPLLKTHRIRILTERMKVLNMYKNDGFVICNEFGGYIEPRTYQDFFKRMLKKAGIENTNFHTLRHTFATRALETGFDVKVLADILGHADASTTLNKYAHALPDHKKTSMEKLSCLYERGIENWQ